MNFCEPHRRYNPLTREWVLISPQRTQRPWLGQEETPVLVNIPPYDPNCYLCPGNVRSEGVRNPNYTSTFTFDNDFPALLPPKPGFDLHELDQSVSDSSILNSEIEVGFCRVVCFSPRHDLSLPELTQTEVEAVVKVWTDQTQQMLASEYINYVQVFENKGAMMGASNPHPHSQVWATGHIPNEPAKELGAQTDYYRTYHSCLLCDVLRVERQEGARIFASNAGFTALVPFWAEWPYEVLVLSNRHTSSLPELNPEEVPQFADILRQVTTRYDNLFEISFSYSMGFHPAPRGENNSSNWHFHAHFYPPLLRSATVRKFMVGFELLGMPQRDITPEFAADRLRNVCEVHYRSKIGK